MKKAIIVVEGQTEQIFVEKFITKLVATQPIHLELRQLVGGSLLMLSPRGVPLEHASHHIRIIDVSNDEKVNSLRRLKDAILNHTNKNIPHEKIIIYNNKSIQLDNTDIEYLENKQIIYVAFDGDPIRKAKILHFEVGKNYLDFVFEAHLAAASSNRVTKQL